MTDPKTSPDIWTLMYEQTPLVLQYVLGVLSLGIFTLIGVMYRWRQAELIQVQQRMDRLESVMNQRHQETNRLLMQIATNTRRQPHRADDYEK